MYSSIVVTGANGLIGKSICHKLQENGLPFLAIARTNKREREPLKWKVKYLDLCDKSSLALISKQPVDWVIHCAAVLPKDGSLETSLKTAEENKILDANVFSFAKDKNAKLIYLSGTSVYGFEKSEKVNETHSVAENLVPYIKQKYWSEQLASQMIPNAIILRISAPYGPEQVSNTVFKIFLEKAIRNEDIFYHGSGARQQDFTNVSDIAEAVLKCIQKNNLKGIYNIASGKPINMRNLANLIISRVPDCKSKVLPSGSLDSQENFRACFSIQKAQQELNWKPMISLEQGIDNWLQHLNK